MSKRTLLIIAYAWIVSLSGCVDAPQAIPTVDEVETLATVTLETEDEAGTPLQSASEAARQTDGLLISELLPGVPGGNSREFIELYNAGTDPVDVDGWTLWYLLDSGQEESLVYGWHETTEVPGLGHYLLVHSGQDFGLVADATFSISLFERKGGVVLRDAQGNDVDRLGWGQAPEGFYAGTAAQAPVDGASLDRLPGGEAGNGLNQGDNATDLVANPTPTPQNSGSSLTPLPDQRLEISLQAPAAVEPGSLFDLEVSVKNLTGVVVDGAIVAVPVADYFELVALPSEARKMNGRVIWTLPALAVDEVAKETIQLRSPYTYLDVLVTGYYAETAGIIRAYGAPQRMALAGGSIPIATARELVGNEVTVEGVATMYTGGFFAGSTGTKFYMEDEGGGVQVYVPGGMGVVKVAIGERVRVTGKIELYRDSIELIPADINADIESLGMAAAPVPTPITVLANETDPSLLGELNVAEGIASRVEEFSYSYEIDLTDDLGNTTLVYVDKLTEATTESMDVGKRYRVTGISEVYDGRRQLYPRLQSDMTELFPPVLALEMQAANNIQPGQELTVTLTARNHTDKLLTDLQITAALPLAEVTISQILPAGTAAEQSIQWNIDELAGNGGEASVAFRILVNESATGSISLGPVQATAAEWRDPVTIQPYLVFVGSGVPIWAIQGNGQTSPYVRNDATTEGVVTAVFPELNGFWIQERESDEDIATSAGLFILSEGLDIPVEVGDLVQVSGKVRELSGQTLLDLEEVEAITVLSSDNDLPAATPYDPPHAPLDALAYNESLEGMLVAVEDAAVAVAPTTQYGEYGLVYPGWGVDHVRRLDEVGFLMMVDDGSSMTHLDQTTLPYAVQQGDRVSGLEGPLAFTFGNYKIEAVVEPRIERDPHELPSFAPAGANQFSVATFNVENLFDLVDPHPTSPPRPSLAEYRLKLDKLAEAILAMGGPTILGLQEVENLDILEDLVALEPLAELGYVPYLIEGTDSRGIDVAYIVRQGLATVEGVQSYAAPEGLTSRPPLLITVTLHLDAGDERLYVLNNHFTSLSGGEEATEPRRDAQAAWNVTVLEQYRAADPAAQFIVLGDLNSFYDTLPIHSLQQAGLRHVYEQFDDESELPYTYIFEGRTQTLDHILVSEGLFDRLDRVGALHIDADYPIASPEDASAERVSDHDPLVAIFSTE